MMKVVRREKLGKDGVPPDLDDWYIPPELEDTAFDTWLALRATDWKLLPESGGLLDQPEGLMQAVYTLSWLHQVCEQTVEVEAEIKKVGL
ncbi:MAG: hypothetical protein K8I82_12740 [Anaerolineae bacterium]|nr:hypothetical protein [Anaerolineae bacterium]